MKNFKNILATVVSTTLLLSSAVSFAEDSAKSCAVISTNRVPHNRDTVELILTSINGERIHGNGHQASAHGSTSSYPALFNTNRTSNGREMIYKNITLAPGIHHFSARAFNSKEWRLGGDFAFTINVEAGKYYNLVAQRTYPRTLIASKKYHARVLSIKDKSCVQSKQGKAHQPMVQDLAVVSDTELPPTLAVEFRQLMLEINDYYQHEHPQKQSITISRIATPDYVFGISGKPIETTTGFGLKITAINTNSTAESLGFKQGDVVIDINGKAITAENLQILSNEIANTQVGEKLSFKVEREGQQLSLNNEYRPATLPAFVLNMDLTAVR